MKSLHADESPPESLKSTSIRNAGPMEHHTPTTGSITEVDATPISKTTNSTRNIPLEATKPKTKPIGCDLQHSDNEEDCAKGHEEDEANRKIVKREYDAGMSTNIHFESLPRNDPKGHFRDKRKYKF